MKTKEQIINYLVKVGCNPEEAAKQVNKNYDVIIKARPNDTIKHLAKSMFMI